MKEPVINPKYARKRNHFNLLRKAVSDILPCPICGNNETKMSKKAFEKICRHRRRQKNEEGHGLHPQCPRCPLRDLMDNGEPYPPPKMITFWTDEEFQSVKQEYER